MIGFFDIIQAYFTKITGRFVMFSARDMALLEQWRGEGASAVVICRGIRDAVLHMDQSKPPRDLYNCRDFIAPHVARARARAVAWREDEVLAEVGRLPSLSLGMEASAAQGLRVRRQPQEASVALRALRSIEVAGMRCDRAEIRELYRQAWYRIREVASSSSVEEQYGALLELEEGLADAYFGVLPQVERERLERRLVDEVSALGMRMSEEAWLCHKSARRRFLMVHEYGLVSLLD